MRIVLVHDLVVNIRLSFRAGGLNLLFDSVIVCVYLVSCLFIDSI